MIKHKALHIPYSCLIFYNNTIWQFIKKQNKTSSDYIETFVSEVYLQKVFKYI